MEKLMNFRIWNTALDAATIKSWMHKTVTSNHPYYNHLQAAYDFNEDTGIIAHDYSVNARHGSLLGLPKWETADLSLRQFNLVETTIRPKFSLYKGNYITHLDSNIVNDTVFQAPVSIIETMPYIDMNVSGISEKLS